MKQKYDTLLADYRKADFNYRLHLFLQLPKIRPEFMAIEAEERRRHSSSEVKSRTNSLTTQVIVALKSVNNGLKRILRYA